MASRWLICLILSGFFSVVLGSGITTAEVRQPPAKKPTVLGTAASSHGAQRLQEMQKALNAEVLSQAFSVPDRKQIRDTTAEPQQLKAVPRHTIRSHWILGHPYWDFSWHAPYHRFSFGRHYRYGRHYRW